MGAFWDLVKMKVKVFLGTFKASRANLALFVFFILYFTAASIGLSMVLADTVRKGSNPILYIDQFSAFINLFFVLVLMGILKGFTVFEYEYNMVLTSPVTPRHYLVANVMADLITYSVFFCPFFTALGAIAVSLGLSVLLTLLTFALSLIFLFFLILLKISFSILNSVYGGLTIKLAIVILMVLLLLPALAIFGYFPLRYRDLPYPSTLLAQSIISLIYNELPPTESFIGITLCFLVSLALFFVTTRRNVFPFAKPTPLMTPFDTSMRAQTLKMSTNIRYFSRSVFRLGVSLNLSSKSLTQFLMKKEFVRMVRDGSLFTSLLMFVIFSASSLDTRTEQGSMPAWIFILTFYSLIIQSILISQWRIGESETLWIPLTSHLGLEHTAKALLYSLVLISFVVPAATICFLTLAGLITPLLLFAFLVFAASLSLIGCSVNLFAAIHFLGKKSKAVPSYMIMLVSLLLLGLLVSPAFGYLILCLILNIDFVVNFVSAAFILIYSCAVFYLLSKKIREKFLNIEL